MLTIVRYLKPGGYIEHQEFAFADGYVLDDNGKRAPYSTLNSAFGSWSGLMCEAQEKRGRTMQLGPHLVSWQKDAGLVDVTESIYAIPVGTWPDDPEKKAIGTQYLNNLLNGFEGFTLALFTNVLGWTPERTREYIDECKVDLRDNSIRKMIDIHVVYGMKPLPA